MAHKMRCKCQNIAIDKLDEDIKNRCILSNGKDVVAILICDFKMKFEPVSARETTLDHFGKRGIPWHGIAVLY